MLRVLKPTGTLLVHNVPKWLAYYAAYLNERAHFRHWIAWDAMGPPLGKTLLPTHYGILYYVKSPKGFKFYDIRAPHRVCRECGAFAKDYGGKKDQMHPFGTLLSDVWTDIHRIRHRKRRDQHPCQLPIPLLERLIVMTTDEGDLVLDPFVGTGTTAIAAKKLGRKYVGIDIDPQYVALAKRKVGEVLPTKINGCYVSLYLGKVLTIRDEDYKKLDVYLSQARHSDKYRKVELPQGNALLLEYH
jgi:site-specific DNA-methyltransferase (adenine-specific)